jgi:putative membrane protein
MRLDCLGGRQSRAAARPGPGYFLEERNMMTQMTSVLCLVALGGSLALSMQARAQASDDDKKFLANAAQSDVNEIKLSQLAEEKASNPAVKGFAERMVKDHTMLETKMTPFATAWGLQTPPDMDQDHKDAYAKLNGLSGTDFDKQYMDDMKSDHTKALDAFTTEVKDTKDAKFKIAVEHGKSVVAAHKNMAYDLRKKL